MPIRAFKGGEGKVHLPTDVCQCLEKGDSGGGGTSNRPCVLDIPKLTSSQKQSTNTTTRKAETMETQLKLEPENSQTLTCWLEDFLAKHSLLLGNVEGLMTPEERSFLKLQGFAETKDPDIFCLKMLRVYYLTTMAKLSRRYLGFLPLLGMTCNGRFLTLKISECPRTGKESSLSDILQEKVADKYFLSESALKGIIKGLGKPRLLEV